MRKAYDFSKLKAVRNPYASKKKAVGINFSPEVPEVIDYFKELADETGLPYQKLIDLYLAGLRETAKEIVDEVGGVAGTRTLKSRTGRSKVAQERFADFCEPLLGKKGSRRSPARDY
jgi:hypothetical protein